MKDDRTNTDETLPSEPGPSDTLNVLLNRLSDGRLSEGETEQLDMLLLSSPAVRRRYIDWMAVESELHARHSEASQATANHVQAAPNLVEPQERATPHTADKPRRSRWAGWLVIAASLVVAAAAGGLLRDAMVSDGRGMVADASGQKHSSSLEPHGAEAVAENAIGKVTATRNCRWSSSAESMGFGAELLAGQSLELVSGIAEITFTGGAKVLLEGPARLDLHGDLQAELVSGRLAATMPQKTPAFMLNTARFYVGESLPLEQAAEFGMLADGQGGGEVHVFDGQVRAHLMTEAGARLRSVDLLTREAARVTPASTTVVKFHANHARFVRSLFSDAGPHGGLQAYEGFAYPAGPLAWQNGGFGWGGPWVDIEASALGENATNEVTDVGLSLDGLVTRGGAALQSGQRNRVRRALSTSLGGVFDSADLVENRDGHRLIGRDGKAIYLSFLQRVSRLNDVFYGFELHRGDGNHNRTLCIGNGADGAGYGVTSNYNAYGKKNYGRLGRENKDANYFVVRIDFGAEDRDQVLVYRNPKSLLDENLCKPDAVLKGNFAFDRISLGNFDGVKTHEVDEIRVATAFRSVTGQRDVGPDLIDRRVVAAFTTERQPRFRLTSLQSDSF